MKNLNESILQVIDVGGTDISGNAKPQATKITGGPHWLQHEITEDAKTDALETSVKGALEQIAQGKTYDEWVKSTSMSPEVKAEVRKRLDAEADDTDDEEESHAGPHHQKDHITKAVFDSLPPEEQEKHQDNLKTAMKSYGMHDDEEEQQPEGEEQPQEEPPPAPQQTNGNGLDYEIEDEKKEKKEPNMKLSKKKEKVTINPKMEEKSFSKRLISELKEKRKIRIDEKAPPGREHQVKSLKKKVGTDGAYAIAWAQHNKHGRPDTNEEVEIDEIVKKGWKKGKYTVRDHCDEVIGTYNSGEKAAKAMHKLMDSGKYRELEVKKEEVEIVENLAYMKNKDGHTFVISKREKKGDKFSMHVQDKSGNKIKDWGSHPSLSGAKKFASNRGFAEEKVDEMSGDMAYRAMDKADQKSRGEMRYTNPAKAKRKARQAQRFADYSIKKTLNKEEVNEKFDDLKNSSQHTMTPLEVLKALKDRVDSKDPSQMEGQSWSDFEQERMDQMSRNVHTGSVLMYRIKDLDTGDAGEIENFTYVMKEKIPKYQQMGYKVVAQ